MRKGLTSAVEAAAKDQTVGAIVLTGGGRGFSAGADIAEFEAPPAPPMLRDVIDALEACPKPIVAAVHGVVLGGGLELALGCDAIVAAPDASLGLPEVKLGLIPGAGGTQRLPRRVGVDAALGMTVSGDPISGRDALDLGLAAKVGEDVVAAAVTHARSMTGKTSATGAIEAPSDLFENWRARTAKKARGLMAPLACIEAVEAAVNLSFEEGMRRERELFIACRDSHQSAAQRHLFKAERSARKVSGVDKATAVRDVRRIAVIGAGTMGGGIAAAALMAGYRVYLQDMSGDAVAAGIGKVEDIVAGAVKRGKLSHEAAAERLAALSGGTSDAALTEADLIIEAVIEEMAVKRALFEKLGRIAKPGATLATNTSSLDVNEIAAAAGRADAVVGLHFFAPAHIMRLLEIVRAAETSPETLATSLAVARRLNKVAVVVGVCDGFVANRMYHSYTRQAYFCVEEGAVPEQVDRVMERAGFAMGPFKVMDLSGLDVSHAVRLRQKQSAPPGERWPILPDRLVEMGWLGRKSGRGWYLYPDNGALETSPGLAAVIGKVSAEAGLARRDVSDDEIKERCLLALANEGVKLMAEGLVERAGDIDVVWRHGYGFPAAEGGPMFWAESKGVSWVAERLDHWARARSGALRPSDLLVEKAKSGNSLLSWKR